MTSRELRLHQHIRNLNLQARRADNERRRLTATLAGRDAAHTQAIQQRAAARRRHLTERYCVYCGHQRRAWGLTCENHRDLPYLDPYYQMHQTRQTKAAA